MMSSKATQREIEAVKRVLEMVDGYLGVEDQDALHACDGYVVMTWGELRQHIKGVLRLSVFKSNGTKEK